MIITGIVENGKQLGRTIGFPTANILMDQGTQMPECGVYAAAILLEGEENPRPCMVNCGNHPTAPEGKPTIEAYILNFSGDIYGKRVKVEFQLFLRPEQRFSGLDALRAQLETDCARTLEWALDNSDIYTWQGIDPDGK